MLQDLSPYMKIKNGRTMVHFTRCGPQVYITHVHVQHQPWASRENVAREHVKATLHYDLTKQGTDSIVMRSARSKSRQKWQTQTCIKSNTWRTRWHFQASNMRCHRRHDDRFVLEPCWASEIKTKTVSIIRKGLFVNPTQDYPHGLSANKRPSSNLTTLTGHNVVHA